MKLEDKVKTKLLSRGFKEEQLLNNRGLIGAAIDETALEVVKNINYDNVLANCKPKKKTCNCPHDQCYAIICTECRHYY